MANSNEDSKYVGTIVGESTTREFRIAVAESAVKEQDIIAVDSEIKDDDEPKPKAIRVWAKVLRIERINPLFPQEAGHELAATQTNPFDTVLSLSREMISAVCQVLGYEPIQNPEGKLDQLRYPAKPATRTYLPTSSDVARIVLGDLNDKDKKERALDVAHLANRKDIDVKIDGHAIVLRHLAILAMTGAGKSWAARKLIEELAKKDYPIVIFDPHGEYSVLADVPEIKSKVHLFHANIPFWDLGTDDAVQVINGLSGEEMTPPQYDAFKKIRSASKSVLSDENMAAAKKVFFDIIANEYINTYPFRKNLFALAYLTEAASILSKRKEETEEKTTLATLGLNVLPDGNLAGTFNALARQIRRAAFALQEMERINQEQDSNAKPLPSNRNDLIDFGKISVVSLAGYSESVKATLYAYIAKHVFNARVQRKIPYQFLLVLEEAHNFVPGKSEDGAVRRSIEVTKQIAQEGRKFGVGLILISQRPSRLDETTLSMCNSFIIMRMVNPTDQNFVRRVVESLGEDEAQNLPNLDKGEALFSGQMINFPVLVKMKKPASTGKREEKDAFVTLRESRQTQMSKRTN